MVVGYYAGIQCAARYGLAALDMAVNRQLPNGARDQGLSLMSDNGWQPTTVAFMQACRLLGSQQAFTSFNHPKGDAGQAFHAHAQRSMPLVARVDKPLWADQRPRQLD
jgi:transposase InsO family protein